MRNRSIEYLMYYQINRLSNSHIKKPRTEAKKKSSKNWQLNNKDKIRIANKSYSQKNKDKVNAFRRSYRKKLPDCYVISLLKKGSSLISKDIRNVPELIQAKKAQLKLHRATI